MITIHGGTVANYLFKDIFSSLLRMQRLGKTYQGNLDKSKSHSNVLI